ncbi:MAG: hypothetical protein ACK42D_03580 [Candidatus Paceibacteria bacterium]
MIDKNQIENILRANGIAPSAKDEEIRSLLLSAKWTENDVDTALMVLKENTSTKVTHIDTLHKVFHSDQRLSPTEITDLLGIKTTLTDYDLKNEDNQSGHQNINVLIALILSVLIAVTSVGYVMYKEKAGFFHPGFKEINE